MNMFFFPEMKNFLFRCNVSSIYVEHIYKFLKVKLNIFVTQFVNIPLYLILKSRLDYPKTKVSRNFGQSDLKIDF